MEELIIQNGNVKKIIEEKDANEEEKAVTTVNAGVYAVDSNLLNEFIPKLENSNAQKEYYLTDIVQMAVEKGLNIEPIEVDEEEFMGVILNIT